MKLRFMMKKSNTANTASIYDLLNAKPSTRNGQMENQKQINLFLLQRLEAKNKSIRQMQEEKKKDDMAWRQKLAVYDTLIGTLQGHIKGINGRIDKMKGEEHVS
jgi:hypothetical protein